MTFILQRQNAPIFYPVTLPIVLDGGAVRTHKFDFQFQRVSRSRLNELQRASEALRDSGVDSLEKDVDYLMEVACGWRGVNDPEGHAVDFNRDHVHQLLDAYPNAAGEIVKAFFEASLGGAKTKN